jgi:hypothetical protein
MLRTHLLAQLLLERLTSLGPMLESDAVEAVEWREPGRGHEVVQWATGAGLIRRVQHDDELMLEAAGAPLRSRSRV